MVGLFFVFVDQVNSFLKEFFLTQETVFVDVEELEKAVAVIQTCVDAAEEGLRQDSDH